MKNTIITLLTIVVLALCFPPQWSKAIRDSICGPEVRGQLNDTTYRLMSFRDMDKSLWWETNCRHAKGSAWAMSSNEAILFATESSFAVWPNYSTSRFFVERWAKQNGLTIAQ